MKLLTKAVKGTSDLFSKEAYEFRFVESIISSIARDFGYNEIILPVFEHTELFSRSVGQTSDVVTKEMYTFNDKSDRSLTLRPEGTAGVMRAFWNTVFSIRPCPQNIIIILPVTDMRDRRPADSENFINSE